MQPTVGQLAVPPTPVLALLVGYVLSGLLGLGLAGYAFRARREESIARAFGYLALLAPTIALGMTGRVLARTVPGKLAWTLVAYVGFVSIGPLVLVFALRYVGAREWVTRNTLVALAVVPAVTMLLVATSGVHDLHYVALGLSHATGWPIAAFRVGPWFWVHTAYEWGLYLFGVFLLARYAVSASEPFRTQAMTLVAALLFMLGVNVAFLVFDVMPFPEADLTPVGAAIGLLAVALAVFRVSFIDVVPVARDRVVEAFDDPVVVVDRRDNVVDTNRAAADVLAVADPMTVEASTALPAAVVDAGLLDGAGEEPVEVQLHVGGEDRWYLVRRQSIEDRAVALIFTDVTERREREERLDQFASVVSHDLRNPLSVAAGSIDMARYAEDPETRADQLDHAAEAVDRIDTLVDDLLTLAREGEEVTDPAPVDIEHVATTAWTTVDTGNATLEVRDSGLVEGDYDRIRRAFENLFRNAVEHGSTSPDSGSGGSVPTAEERAQPTDGGQREDGGDGEGGVEVRVGTTADGFYVADDGPGIPEGEREQVFDRGYTTSDDGVGLGLAIVDSVARVHGWSIDVIESSAGGARFEFTTDGVEA